KGKKPKRDYILLPLLTANSPFSITSKSSQHNEFQPSNDGAKTIDKDLRKENECNDQREEDSTNNTNRVNTVTSNINATSSIGVNVVGTNISIDLPPDLNMPLLEDIDIFEDSRDDEDIFDVKKASTPMETSKTLLKDEDEEEVDVYMYRSMIGSLMYLTSSRLDIMFACKKQTVVANSTTEAEYVVASSCYGQVLWIQNQLLDYGKKNKEECSFDAIDVSDV
nr:hypothetical protein [Tanacetum cinerariifolium]